MKWQEIAEKLSRKSSETLLIQLIDRSEFTSPVKLTKLDKLTSTIGFPVYRNGEIILKLFGKNKGRPDLSWMACSNISDINFI